MALLCSVALCGEYAFYRSRTESESLVHACSLSIGWPIDNRAFVQKRTKPRNDGQDKIRSTPAQCGVGKPEFDACYAWL